MELAPEVFAADYTGRPGERTFFLQTRGPQGTHSFLLEKQQVQLLAEKMRELLLLIDARDTVSETPPARDPALALEGPIEPEWRIGAMGLGFDDATETVVLTLDPVAEEQDDEEAEEREFAVRVMLRTDQVRSFVVHALSIVGEGREVCQLCGLPMDPAGHRCPASNGHHPAE